MVLQYDLQVYNEGAQFSHCLENRQKSCNGCIKWSQLNYFYFSLSVGDQRLDFFFYFEFVNM